MFSTNFHELVTLHGLEQCITPRVTQYTRMSKKKYVNYALHVGFWNCLYMSFCFMMKKDHSNQKLLLWPQVPLKTNLDSNGFLFLNKIYSSLADEKKRADELDGSILFSYGKTNFCRITIGYIGNNKVDILDEK